MLNSISHWPIRNWIVTFAGFLQNPRRQRTGVVRLWRGLHAIYTAADTCALLCAWNDNTADLAEFIFQMRPDAPPKVLVVGYSWGGYAAARLAYELQARDIAVDRMVLCDAVYRWRFGLFGQVRALLPGSKIAIPANVRRVDWLRQACSWPRGHQLVADDSSKTEITPPVWLPNVSHSYMDDAEEFRELAAIAADNLFLRRPRIHRP